MGNFLEVWETFKLQKLPKPSNWIFFLEQCRHTKVETCNFAFLRMTWVTYLDWNTKFASKWLKYQLNNWETRLRKGQIHCQSNTNEILTIFIVGTNTCASGFIDAGPGCCCCWGGGIIPYGPYRWGPCPMGGCCDWCMLKPRCPYGPEILTANGLPKHCQKSLWWWHKGCLRTSDLHVVTGP